MPDGHPHSAWHSLVPTRCIVCSLYYAREGPARAPQAVHPAVVVLRHSACLAASVVLIHMQTGRTTQA
jgi:hypothetical protein